MTIHTACRLLGGPSKMARALGITPAAVGKWLKNGRVPIARVLEIERLTHGAVSRTSLRPDCYPPDDV